MDEQLENAIFALNSGQISKAYQILSDLEKKSEHDKNYSRVLKEIINYSLISKEPQLFYQTIKKYFNEVLKNNNQELLIDESKRLEKTYYGNKARAFFLESLARTNEDLGRLKIAHTYYNNLIDYLFKIKSYQKLESLIDEQCVKYPRDTWYLERKIELLYISKNKIDSNLMFSYLALAKSKEIKEFITKLKDEYVASEENEDLFKILLLQSLRTKKEKKRIINFIILNATNEQLILFYKFCGEFKCPQTQNELKNYLIKYQKKKFKSYIENISSKDLAVKFQDGDLKKYLYENLEKKHFYEKYKEERKIYEISSVINKIDPFYQDEQEILEEQGKIKVNDGSTSVQIIQNLLAEIAYYSGERNNDITSDLEAKLKFVIKKMYEDDWDVKLSDILSMLYSFEFYDLVIELAKKWKELNPYEETILVKYLEINYVEAVANFELKKYYENIKNLNWLTTTLPLQKDESICFTYLLAENLNALGAKEEALNCYKKIQRLSENYRMTKNRIREIEKN